MIQATTIDKDYKYMDFFFEGLGYRYDARTDRFSKLYHLPGDYAKAVRGKKRAAVLALVKNMYLYNIRFAILQGI